MKTYAEKLKDPRWQRKRLEIMDRDCFKCRVCGSATTTLHIHHIRYIKGREPWDYKEFYLVTLCEDCHKDEEKEIKSPVRTRPPKANHPTMAMLDSLVAASPENPPGDHDQPATEEEMRAFFRDIQASLSGIDRP